MNLHNNNSTIGIHWQNWRCNRLQSKSGPWCSPQPLIFLLNKIRSFAATKFLANAEAWVFSGSSKVVVYLVWYGMVEPHVSAPLLVDVRFSSDLLLCAVMVCPGTWIWWAPCLAATIPNKIHQFPVEVLPLLRFPNIDIGRQIVDKLR